MSRAEAKEPVLRKSRSEALRVSLWRGSKACRGAWRPGWARALPEGPRPSSCEGPPSVSLVCA